MADSRSNLQGNPQDFEPESGTAKLERKKVVLSPSGDTTARETDPDDVQTAELRERMKLSLRKSEPAPEEDTTEAMTTELAPPPGGDKPGTERVVKKTSMRLSQSGTNKLTESRRMLRPTGTRQPTDSKKMLRPKSLAGMSDSSRLQRPRSTSQMTEEEKIQTQELLPHEMDPSRRRETDTANLKRIRPGKTSAEGVTAGGETGTDTIHLRVIKEKKNQLKNILSASQTIRLRPSQSDTPSGRQDQAAAPATPTPEPGAPATQQGPTGTESTQKRTLKIKVPTEGQPMPVRDEAPTVVDAKEDPGTAMLKRDQLKDTEVPTALKRRAPSLQPRGEGEVKTDTVKLKAPVRPPTQDEEGKATLKIKAPPTAAPQPAMPGTETRPVPGAEDKKSTLKIKAPVSPASGDVTQRSPAPGALTVKQEAPTPAGGKTLKLKAAPKTLQAPAVSEPAAEPATRETAAAPAREPETVITAAGDEPGVLYTLGAAASFFLIFASVALAALSYQALYLN